MTTTLADARLSLLAQYAGIAMRAALAQQRIPEVIQIYGEVCEDGASAMVYWQLDPDELTGGLPLYASFDLPAADPNGLDPADYLDALMQAERASQMTGA